MSFRCVMHSHGQRCSPRHTNALACTGGLLLLPHGCHALQECMHPMRQQRSPSTEMQLYLHLRPLLLHGHGSLQDRAAAQGGCLQALQGCFLGRLQLGCRLCRVPAASHLQLLNRILHAVQLNLQGRAVQSLPLSLGSGLQLLS